MGLMGHYSTLALILLFIMDVFTDIANGIELILNDHVVCKFFMKTRGDSVMGCLTSLYGGSTNPWSPLEMPLE